MQALKLRFEAKVIKTETCWLWTGSKTAEGYGHIKQDRYNRPLLAHRVSYELYIGPIPKGKTLDHLCRNTSCVNPAHLEPITRGENVLRGFGPTAQNARKLYCINGHALILSNVRVYSRSNGRTRRVCLVCVKNRKKGIKNEQTKN